MKLGLVVLLMVSQFLSRQEAYYSPTAERLGIDNTPTLHQEELVSNLANCFFDSLRIRLDSPLYVSSCFRSPDLNRAVGGAKYSDHQALKDTAALDIDQDGRPGPTNAEVFEAIRQMEYYKLIWEFGTQYSPAWVHVAYSTDATKNAMKNTYRAKRHKNTTVYERI